MGCDYYKDVFVRFVYISTEGTEKEVYYQVDHLRCYISSGEFEPNFTTLNEYLNRLQHLSPMKPIYVESQWICLPDSVPYYKELIRDREDIYELVSIYKVAYFKPREHTSKSQKLKS